LKDIIEAKIHSREFTFMELLKIDKLAKDLANETYEELTTTQRLGFAWEVKITSTGSTFGALFRSATITSLQTAFSEALKEFMENAKVTSQGEPKMVTTFESPAKKEQFVPETVEELVLNKELIQPDDFQETIEDKKTTTFSQKDGTNLPKGVKRLE
jgi:hypothetical protein